jgi:DNA-3-methyladenine glycosylase II
MSQRTFSMAALPPFRLDLTVWALRRRPDNAVDAWDGRTHRRALEVDGVAIEVATVQSGSPLAPRIAVQLTGERLDEGIEQAARSALTRLLGLDRDLSPFYDLAEEDPVLRTLARRFRGVKPPRFPTLFECIVSAIACQQLTLTVGVRLINRLAGRYGARATNGVLRTFPSPAVIARLAPEALRPLGFELANAVHARSFASTAVEALDDRDALQALEHLRGVGRWTAEYALLRGLGRLHVFPGDDVGARNNLARWLDCGGPLDYEGVRAAVRRWQPYAGLVYFHLLLANLEDRGAFADRPITVPASGAITMARASSGELSAEHV